MNLSNAYARVRQYTSLAAGALGLSSGRAAAGPLHAQIGIADPCNHKCVMCWDHPATDHASDATLDRFAQMKPGMMCFDTFRGIVTDLHDLGTRRVDIVGRGEPLLNADAARMVAFARRTGMLVTLCTNASKLSREIADGFVEVGLDRMNVSLNAGTPQTYPLIHVTETPENYLSVKSNLRYLADRRAQAGKKAPYVKLSFVVGARNAHEVEQMVSVTHEVGADAAMFIHTTIHDGTRDLALTREQHNRLLESVPRARDLADRHGVATNLATFAATVPTYLQEKITGPPIVPCYVGWYFTVILGNGSVMPCCQCSKPVDRISEDKTFADIWSSEEYRKFRTEARSLPDSKEFKWSCECDRCMLRPRNITVHNMLNPHNRIEGGDDEQLFTGRDLFRMRKVDRS